MNLVLATLLLHVTMWSVVLVVDVPEFIKSETDKENYYHYSFTTLIELMVSYSYLQVHCMHG